MEEKSSTICYQKVRENKNQISDNAHNLFGFEFFFYLKGLRLGVWWTTNLSIGWLNLTNINFGNIGEEIKFAHTIKYYQQSLSTVAATLTDEEK